MNEPDLLPDDPKVTAYALGELTGDERAAVEAALRRDPALRMLVDELRGTAAQLESALAEEPVPFEKPKPVGRLNRYRIWRRKSPRRLALPQREAAKPADDYAPRRRGKLLEFPQFYYVIGGLAAACFAVFIALRRDDTRAHTQTHLASTPTASAVASEPAVAATHVAENLAPAPAAPASPAFISGNLSLLGQAKHETESDTAASAKETPGAIATDSAAIASAMVPAPVASSATASEIPASVPPLTEPTTEREPTPTFAGVAPLIGGDAPAGPRRFRGYPAPATGATSVPTLSARAGAPTLVTTDAVHHESAKPATLDVAMLSHAAQTSFSAPRGTTVSSAPAPTSATPAEDIVKLSAFMVSAERSERYSAASMATQRIAERESLPRPPRGAKFARSGEDYSYARDNEFERVAFHPTSTFAVGADTASYANVRRFIESGTLPPRDAVRIEEFLNYFPYRYAAPKKADEPFAASLEVSEAPWEPTHRLVRIGLKARDVAPAERPAANLVFLLDVSASMDTPNKLPLVKESLRLLVHKLRADDRVAIVTYAGKSGVALGSTPAGRPDEILAAIDGLAPGGSAAGSAGIQLAYEVAGASFTKNGINRVILCTDGDFNLGVTSEGDLVRLIQQKAAGGVYLTVLGFGMGTLKDSKLEKLASHGNGTYGYVDTRREAEKLLVEQVSSTLLTVAKDVKIQVEFNSNKVASYRLIGYENRLLRREDFNDEKVDAGEIGAGQTLTALYEIVPVGLNGSGPAAESPLDELRYVTSDAFSSRLAMPGTMDPARARELLNVTVRYKKPDGLFPITRSQEFPVVDGGAKFAEASPDFRFAAAVAEFGMILRDSPHKGAGSLGDVLAWAANAATKPADDPGGYRGEFIDLVRKAQVLMQ